MLNIKKVKIKIKNNESHINGAIWGIKKYLLKKLFQFDKLMLYYLTNFFHQKYSLIYYKVV